MLHIVMGNGFKNGSCLLETALGASRRVPRRLLKSVRVGCLGLAMQGVPIPICKEILC